MKRNIFLFTLLLTTLHVMGTDLTGTWNGTLNIQNQSMRFVLHLSKDASGYKAVMDSPDQGAKGIQMSHVTLKDSVLTVELRIAQMKYEGKIDNNIINGQFSQAGLSVPLVLTKSNSTEIQEKTAATETNTFQSEQPVVLETKKGKIFGTLSTPKSFETCPIALIIAGSGPTDRNGNNPTMTNDAYKKIASALAKNGIASLRYDKRGIAESAAAVENEADLIFSDYALDATGWIEWLRKDKRFTKIVVAGHSEGSLIGMMAADKADGFISIAGAGKSIGDILKEQLRTQPQSMQDQAGILIDSLSKGLNVHNVSPELQPLFRPSIQPYMMSWLKLNPQTELKKLKVPVLIIQGTTDIQIGVEDAKLLAKAKPEAKLLIIEKMNHILRTVDGDSAANLSTYNNASLPLSEGLISGISEFILKK